jgi:hypothetical protein
MHALRAGLLLLGSAVSANECVHTEPGAAYTNISGFLTWEAPPHSPVYNLELSGGRYCGDLTDPAGPSGSNGTGEISPPSPLNLHSA